MSKFVLTAQLKLQAPTNTRQVVQEIRRQLRGVEVPVEIKQADQARKQIKSVTDETKKATGAAQALGKSFGLAIKRFAAFTVASRAVSLFTNSLANAVDEAIAFERELIKIEQVSGASEQRLKSLTNTINQLSAGLGTSSKDLLGVARILSQAGVQAQDLDTALSALAKTTLAATFDDIGQTAEGAVAILRQFDQGVGSLEAQLGSINAVAGQFAVESGDLIGAVRRFGGVFKSAGGSLEELLAVFTSVRATTRESAESISTGLRTIFTRIQRPATIQFLKQFGVELTDLDGKFVGPFEAAKRLSEAFAGLEQGDVRFIRIAEELGGFRQIGKVIPLLQQFSTAQEALKVAQEGQNSLTKDAETAQKSLAVQITKVKEEFFALVRGITADTSFQFFARTALQLASALLKVADAIKPLIPLISAFAAIKFASGFSSFLGGAGAAVRGLGRSNGGVIQAFARGGFVPGTGNRDTVPAMLTPGEFVIKKSSAQKLGAGTLQAMNQNRFAAGGIAKQKDIGIATPDVLNKDYTTLDGKAKVTTDAALKKKTGFGQLNSTTLDALYAKRVGGSAKLKEIATQAVGFGSKSYGTIIEGVTKDDKKAFDTAADKGAIAGIRTAAIDFSKSLGAKIKASEIKISENFKVPGGFKGEIFEGVLDAFNGQPIGEEGQESKRPFDFVNGVKQVGTLFDTLNKKNVSYVDAKVSKQAATVKGEFEKKLVNQLADDLSNDKNFKTAIQTEEQKLKQKKAGPTPAATAARAGATTVAAAGGAMGGGDTVPALLTPGEFVINKSAAKSIGYGNLNSMNKTGVARFAKGGSVGVQRLQAGGVAGGGFAAAAPLVVVLGAVQQAIEKFGDTSLEASDATANTTIALREVAKGLTQLVVTFLILSKVNGAIKNWTNATKEATTAEKESASASRAEAQAKSESSEATAGGQKGDGVGDAGAGEKVDKATQSIEKYKKAQETAATAQQKNQVATEKLTKRQELHKAAVDKEKAALEQVTATRGKDLATQQQAIAKYNEAKAAREKAAAAENRANLFAKQRQAVLSQEAAALLAAQKAADKYIPSLRAIGRDIQATITRQQRRINALIKEKTVLSVTAAVANAAVSPFKTLGAALSSATTQVKKLGDQLKRSLGPGSQLRQSLGKGAQALTKALGVVQTIFITAQTAARAFSGIFEREEEKAKGEGDINKANEALKGKLIANALAERLSFTGIVTGIVESIAGGESFGAGLKRAFDKGSVQNAEAITQATITSQLEEARRAEGNRGQASVAAASEIGTDVRASLDTISKTTRLSDSERRTAVLKQEQLAVKAATELGKTANSAADLDGVIQALATGNAEFDEKVRQAAEASFALAQAQKEVTKANFDSLKITSAFNSANAAVKAFQQSLVTGAPALDGFLTTLEASQSNIGIDASEAISGIESQLLASSGGNTGLENAIRGQADVAREVNTFSKNIQAGVNQASISRNDPEKAKADLEAALLEGIDLTSASGDQLRNIVRGRLGQINEENVATIDISEIISDIQKQAGSLSKGFTESAKALALHNKTMDGLYKKQEELENKQVAAQNKYIDTQLEVAKILQSVGGDRVTLEDKLNFSGQKINNILGTVGLAGSDTANALGDIGARFSALQAGANLSAQAVAAGTASSGVFAGASGRQQDNREQLKKATEGLIVQTKERIKLYQEELNIVKKKNEAERSALEKLVTGDIEGFLGGIETAGAQAVLQTGDANLAGLFGASTLGKAFVQGKDFLGADAAGLALGAVGIKDTRAADILAGGGGAGEVESIQDAIRQEAQNLEAASSLQAEFATAEMTANQVIIDASEVAFRNARNATATGFARGGTVYANRGMFIPRGTDTVPAMLTPGEFVVNRAAVARGNNLQILRAMNGQGLGNAPSAGSAAAMSRGGSVGYYQDGGQVSGGISMSVVEKLNSAFSTFEKSVNKLVTSKFQVSLDTAQVNVVFNGGSFLNNLTDQVRTELFKYVGSELQKGKFDNTGNLQSSDSVLGN